jgi:hypothetical protein
MIAPLDQAIRGIGTDEAQSLVYILTKELLKLGHKVDLFGAGDIGSILTSWSNFCYHQLSEQPLSVLHPDNLEAREAAALALGERALVIAESLKVSIIHNHGGFGLAVFAEGRRRLKTFFSTIHRSPLIPPESQWVRQCDSHRVISTNRKHGLEIVGCQPYIYHLGTIDHNTRPRDMVDGYLETYQLIIANPRRRLRLTDRVNKR